MAVTVLLALSSLIVAASGLTEPLYQPQKGRTVGLQPGLRVGSDDVPIEDAPWARTVTGSEPEQINLAYHSPTSVMVSWATEEAWEGEGVQAWNLANAVSEVHYGTAESSLTQTAYGYQTFYQQNYYIPDQAGVTNYTSPVLHHVLLSNLPTTSTIYYQVGDGQTFSETFSFKTLQKVQSTWSPYRWTVTADLGGTYNSTVTLEHMLQAGGDVSLLIGDLVYADNYLFYRFMQPLWSNTPLLATNGNHEYELSTDGQTYAAYIARYVGPYSASLSEDPMYYSTDLPGVHLISLSAYRNYNESSAQYVWLQQDLERFDRSRTPWLVVIFHPPMYNTYVSHYKEVECMRLAMEPLFYEYGVDLIMAGHVHGYERNNRVYNYTVEPCAPVYITIGDGGNIEEIQTTWADQPGQCPKRSKASSPGSKFMGNCYGGAFQPADAGGPNNGYCATSQPEWSAVRESSFGHGTLDILNSTHLLWRWHRNQDSEAQIADEHYIVREPDACENQNVAPAPTISLPAVNAPQAAPTSAAGK